MIHEQRGEASTIVHLIRIFAEQKRLAQLELEAALVSQNRIETAVARLTITRLMADSTELLTMLFRDTPAFRTIH